MTIRHFKLSLAIMLLSAPVWGQTTGGQSEPASAAPDVALGRPLVYVSPNYPDDAFKSKLEGSVGLVLTIDPEGNTTDVSVISGDAEFADAAVKAVRQWKYLPQPTDEMTEKVTTKVIVTFRITWGKPNVTLSFEEPTTPSERAIFKMGKDVTPPQAVYSPNPEYSEQARRDIYEGTCLLSVVVGPDGVPRNVHVVRTLGMGLDEKAIETVRNWRFSPATKDGKPVSVAIMVEVMFHLFHPK